VGVRSVDKKSLAQKTVPGADDGAFTHAEGCSGFVGGGLKRGKHPRPICKERRIAAISKAPKCASRHPAVRCYLSFSVVSANRANTRDAIQKRTMILDSDQPSNSK